MISGLKSMPIKSLNFVVVDCFTVSLTGVEDSGTKHSFTKSDVSEILAEVEGTNIAALLAK